MSATRRSHPCPAGCGHTVPHRRFACPTDWARLPAELQEAIGRTYRNGTTHDHLDAMAAAVGWYRDNPRPHTITP